jgi:WD40 repeat protein
MDFNPFNPKLFATGSIDKLVKVILKSMIIFLNALDLEYKIKYLSGVGFVKWKPDDETKMCVSSYSGDNSLSMWNTEQIHYPMGILKGHKDVVTACVYETALYNYFV